MGDGAVDMGMWALSCMYTHRVTIEHASIACSCSNISCAWHVHRVHAVRMPCANDAHWRHNIRTPWGGRQTHQTSKVHYAGYNWPFIFRLGGMKDPDVLRVDMLSSITGGDGITQSNIPV